MSEMDEMRSEINSLKAAFERFMREPGPMGPQGPTGPSGPPGRGLDDLSVAGAYRAKLQSAFELMVALQVEARTSGLSTGARRALKKARRYIKKAVGAIVTDNETSGGEKLRVEREARRLERKAKKKSKGEEDEEEEDDDDSDSDEDDEDQFDDDGDEEDNEG